MTLDIEVGCGHCDWCTRSLYKFCEDGGPIGMAARQRRVNLFAGLPSGSPPVTCNTNAIHYQGTAVFGAYSSSLEDCLSARERLATGRLRPSALIAYRYPLSEIGAALETVKVGRTLKAVLYPQQVRQEFGQLVAATLAAKHGTEATKVATTKLSPGGINGLVDRLAGRVALVTGAGQGIGRGIALSLARAGAEVAINDISSSAAKATAADVAALGRCSLAVQTDVSQTEDVQAMIDRVVEEFGTLHILVNNAGVCTPAFITDLSEDMWDRTMRVNLKSMFLCSKAVVPLLMAQRYGKIVNVSSKSGKQGGLWLTAYCASKFGVIGFTQCLALELAPYGVNVNAICPGQVYTPMWDNVLKKAYARKLNMDEDQVRDYYNSKVPLGREVTLEEIGSVVAFLCSDQASYMTGQAINITGGQEMR